MVALPSRPALSWLALVVVCSTILFSPAGWAKDKAAAVRPRLVVVVSVDQLRFDYITRFRNFLPKDGIRTLLQEGAFFTDAHYKYASTFTAPGHAVQLTGTYSYRNGIVSNRMYQRATGKDVEPVKDTTTQLVGAKREATGSSPRLLIGSTVGDELRLATNNRAKVVTMALKDRASVLLGGHSGKAYWFDSTSGRFVTSSYYHDKAPKWLCDFNDQAGPDQAFGTQWKRIGPEPAYTLATIDDAPFEGERAGLGRTFPHPLTGENNTRDKSYYRAWTFSPHAIHAQGALAKEIIVAEELGKDSTPDLLGISLNTPDYVGHTFGPHSHEMIAMFFEVDRFMRDLLTTLNEEVGKGKFMIAFTADHGVAPIPQYAKSLGMNAGRVHKNRIQEVAEKALEGRYGKGPWVLSIQYPSVALDWDRMDKAGLDREEVRETAAVALRKEEGIAQVVTRTQILRKTLPNTPMTQMITRSFHPDRSGDLMVVLQPYWVLHKYGRPLGTGHGSPYTYDTHVPLILYGASIRPGVLRHPVEITALAPTLSSILGVSPPSQNEGQILQNALR
jgi:predicted AlkP superfamily pyrophosphatase or phosphodiesterase